MLRGIKFLSLGLALALAGNGALAAEISGAGASFPYPIYAKWANAYYKRTGNQVNYQSIGSGGGIRQITAKTVDFGASDAPLPPEKLDKLGLTQWPMVIGGIVPVVNLKGIEGGQIKLSNEVLADIFLGKITSWDDPIIRKLNPGLQLPAQRVTIVHRADGSGTTFVFTDYLSKVSDAWKERVGSNTAVSWPTGVGAKGNEGVAAYIARIKGAIGYVEYAYALENGLTHVQLRNRTGEWVQPDADTFQAAAADADWQGADGMYLMLTDQPGARSWPIAAATFILMHKQQQDPQAARDVLKFFQWAFEHGGAMANELHYVPMPSSVVDYIESRWGREMTDAKGKSVWQ